MMRTIAVALVILVTLVFVAGLSAQTETPKAAPKTHNYVSADKCKMCHQGEAKGMVWQIWEKSAHAKAYQALVDKKDGSEKNATCLGCHTTGMGKATGYAVSDTTDHNKAMANVGCEACHGPGSDYRTMAVMKDKAKATEAGLIIPDEKVCVGCHNKNSPTFKSFDYATFWKKIQHPMKAAGATK